MVETDIYVSVSHSDTEVEVVRVNAETAEGASDWCGGVLVEEINPFDTEVRTPGVNVPTAIGNQRASNGDYIVRLPAGDFWVVPPHNFSYTYELKQ